MAEPVPPCAAAHVFIDMLPDMVKVGSGASGSQGKKGPVAFQLHGRRVTAQVRLEGIISGLPSKRDGGNYVLDDGTGRQSFNISKFCRYDQALFEVGDPYAIVGKWKIKSRTVAVTHVYRLLGTPASQRELWEMRGRHLWEHPSDGGGGGGDSDGPAL